MTHAFTLSYNLVNLNWDLSRLGIDDNYIYNNLFQSDVKNTKDTIKRYHNKIYHLII